jgi:hypothetical protein
MARELKLFLAFVSEEGEKEQHGKSDKNHVNRPSSAGGRDDALGELRAHPS